MIDKWSKRFSIEDKGLKLQFRIFSLLLLLGPVMVFSYILTDLATLTDLLQAKYIVPYLLSLIIVLSVLALLQTMFSHLSRISLAMQQGSEQQLIELTRVQGANELRGIVDSFGVLLKQYQEASGALERRAVELLLIKELAEEASANLDLKTLLNSLLDKVMQINRAKIGSVFLVDESGERLKVVSSRGVGREEIDGISIAVKDSLASLVLDGREGELLVENIETDSRVRKKNDPKYGSPSFLLLPVRAGEKIIAVINLAHKSNGEMFRQEDVDLATIMIQEVGFALENARIHTEIKDHARRLEQQTAALQEEIHRRMIAEKELEKLAHKDTLTGLANRHMFIDRIEVAVAMAHRHQAKLAVMFVDLDMFKAINDTLGHAAGDEVLCEVSRRMQACLRETDLIARYGGDEFTVILTEVSDSEGINNVASKIIHTLQQPIEVKGETRSVGCSIGIAIYPDDAEDYESLIRHADKAMYISKRVAGSSFHYYATVASRI
ncbi:sensor domain-containing diguanylate cyclase [Mariprofundus ferrinatatus]|uniref:sensor domain-containing diguanylate cyclase n=1 Tax=Mariprofundus ferrinatatus TaxID=1921087 RepID=UPI000C221581|nr:sensor domain-containing diguanylate cyclase [Mariprofundus ferrinatatus]